MNRLPAVSTSVLKKSRSLRSNGVGAFPKPRFCGPRHDRPDVQMLPKWNPVTAVVSENVGLAVFAFELCATTTSHRVVGKPASELTSTSVPPAVSTAWNHETSTPPVALAETHGKTALGVASTANQTPVIGPGVWSEMIDGVNHVAPPSMLLVK